MLEQLEINCFAKGFLSEGEQALRAHVLQQEEDARTGRRMALLGSMRPRRGTSEQDHDRS